MLALQSAWSHLLKRTGREEPWQGVPQQFRSLPIGRFSTPEGLAEWQAQRNRVKALVLASLGELPPRPSINSGVRIRATDRKDGYRVESFVFPNGADSDVPGYIAIPAGNRGRCPAILALHGHGSSKDHIFGYRASTQNVAERLVRRGYIVLGIDSSFNGERKGEGPAGGRETLAVLQEQSLFKLNLWLGRTLWGMMLRDQQIALDYLCSRPEVDAERIGAQGMSMGSSLAWWLAAIDERIKAAVGVAAFTRYEDLLAAGELSAHGIYYFVYGILKHFDAEAVLALIAPRAFLALTGDRDRGSPLPGIRKLEQTLAHVYALYERPEAFRSIVYAKTGHVYTDEMKERMVDWFDKFLR